MLEVPRKRGHEGDKMKVHKSALGSKLRQFTSENWFEDEGFERIKADVPHFMKKIFLTQASQARQQM